MSADLRQITSLQGQRLDQMYPKKRAFQADARTWYLPIWPTPDHPDAISKATKKRFPTLNLTDGARLRYKSYVNIRDVFKIDWSLLRPYTNAQDADGGASLSFDRVSRMRLLAKSKALVEYEPGPQLQSVTESKQGVNENSETAGVETEAEAASAVRSMSSATNSMSLSDFQIPGVERGQIARTRLKAPPDPKSQLSLALLVPESIRRPVDRMLGSVRMPVQPKPGTPFVHPNDLNIIAGSMNRLWRDAKGVTAVVIASI